MFPANHPLEPLSSAVLLSPTDIQTSSAQRLPGARLAAGAGAGAGGSTLSWAAAVAMGTCSTLEGQVMLLAAPFHAPGTRKKATPFSSSPSFNLSFLLTPSALKFLRSQVPVL